MRKKLLLPLVAALSFFLGFEAGSYQLALLSIAGEFKTNAVVMGFMVAAQYVAIMVTPLLFGRLSDIWGKKRVLARISLPLFIGGCLLAALSKTAFLFAVGVFIIGAGFSICETVSGAALIDAMPEKGDRNTNLTQAFFCAGAVLGPILTQRFMAAGQSWRISFLLCAAADLLLLPLLLSVDFGAPTAVEEEARKLSLWQLLRSTPGFVGLLVAMLMYVAVENGFAYFADSLFVLELDAARLGAYAVSAFWFSMGITRIVFGMFRYSARKVLMGCELTLVASLLLMAVCRSPWVAITLCLVSGAACGPSWPLIFSMGTRSAPGHTGAASSLISVSSGMGGAVSPALMGALSTWLGLRSCYLMLALFSLCGFLGMWLIYGKGRRGKAEDA